MAPSEVEYTTIDGDQAARQLDELSAFYREVYAEPPYQWGDEHVELFQQRFETQCQQDGFALIEGRAGSELVGMGFGVTLRPNTQWWQHLITPLPEHLTRQYPGRTWALVELLVRAPWRRRR